MKSSISPNGRSNTARSSVYIMIVAVAAASCPISGSAATRTPPSSSRPWSCRRPGRARRVEDTLKQVTERLERKLQETPNLDFLRSFTRAGVTTIFVNLKGSARQGSRRHWYHVRKSIGDIATRFPPASSGPASTTSSAIHSGSSTASRRRLHPSRTARLCRGFRSKLLLVARRIKNRDSGGPGRENLRRILDEGAGQPGH